MKKWENLEKQVILKHIYKNELDKACFALDTAYCDSKDLTKGSTSDKILKETAYEIAKNLGYDVC